MIMESDTAREARLSREAQTVNLGRLLHPDLSTPNFVPNAGTSVRVEITYTDENEFDHCGYLLVAVPSIEVDGMSDDEALAAHPATLASDVVDAWLNERAEREGWIYTSIDDTYSA